LGAELPAPARLELTRALALTRRTGILAFALAACVCAWRGGQLG
jgi:hypothetical protein